MAVIPRLLATIIVKAWFITLPIVPLTCIVLIIAGIPQMEIEDSVYDIWVRMTSDFRKDVDYQQEVAPPIGSSIFLGIAVPKTGGNALTVSRLLALRDRQWELENATVTVDGNTYHWEDMCTNPVQPYVLPCVRMTVLDCYFEGGYNFDEVAAARWRELVQAQQPPELMVAALYQPIVETGIEVQACSANCENVGGFHPDLAGTLGVPEGAQYSDPNCTACIAAVYGLLNDEQKDAAYYTVVSMMVPMMGARGGLDGLNVAMLMAMYQTDDERIAMDRFLLQMMESGLQQRLAGQNPYSFQLVPDDKLGLPRPRLVDPNRTTTTMADAEVLRHASETCISWIHLLPPNLKELVYGEARPADYNVSRPMTSVDALQSIYFLQRSKFLPARVSSASRPARFGGPINISEEKAEEVLAEYKNHVSEIWSRGWDTDDGELEMTAFADDAGGGGTFRNTLQELSASTGGLIYPYVIVMLGVTMFFYFDYRSATHTRSLLAGAGTIMVCLGVMAALAMTALAGNKLNVVHIWCVPFLLTGVGIDDMFLVSNAAQDAPGRTAEQKLESALSEIIAPVTMTSLMNLALFATLLAGSDIPGIYLAGLSGVFGIGLAYLMMVISFPSLVYLDIRRRETHRFDGLCCMKSAEKKELKDNNTAFNYVYKPLVANIFSRLTLIVAPLIILVIAIVFLPSLERGLDLADFFPANTREGQYSKQRDKYFPAWPIRICWGDVAYEDPDVQMHMVSQWEKMLDTPYVASDGLVTGERLWIASLALWMLPCAVGQSCGPRVDPMCRSRYKANTKGLKTIEQGGYCLVNGSCPVIEGLTQEQMADCIGYFNAPGTFAWNLLSTGIPMEDAPSRRPKVPMMYSEAGGTSLFGYNLRGIEAFENLITQTREFTDEDDTIGRTWMNGIPYVYFEQYLTVVDSVMTLSGVYLAVCFAVAWVFLFLEFTSQGAGTVGTRLVGATVGSIIVAVYAGMSVVATCGWISVFAIKLNGFTAMAALLSLGLSVEYTVHVVHRFITADARTGLDRVLQSMEFLFLPTFLGFLTTAISVLMLALGEFTFVRKYYFAPLAITTLITYTFGIFTLPAMLTFCGFIPILKTHGEAPEAAPELVSAVPEPSQNGNAEINPAVQPEVFGNSDDGNPQVQPEKEVSWIESI